ncbi:MAG TPA: class I SAM-dependent methyltransferase [archaeon]|nr:class I SAM-dependent methyltransferase [archaeon]
MECADFEFREKKVRLSKCGSCGTVYVSPPPAGRRLSEYYKGNYYEKPGFVFGIIQGLRKNFFSGIKPGKALDVGCGAGTFLKTMKSLGWECHGIEVSESSKKFTGELASQGIDIKYGDLLKAGYKKNSFDLITFWHVAEHLNNPGLYLAHSRELLKKGGLLFIAVPNINSLSFRLWKSNWFHLDVPRHLSHFSPETISALAEKNGFRIVKISHYSLEFNPFGVMQSMYNSIGFEFNFLYRLMKRKPVEKGAFFYMQLLLAIVTLPVLAPLSILIAYIFSFFGRGDTIQLLAEKR